MKEARPPAGLGSRAKQWLATLERRGERHGVLEQTLVAAYPSLESASAARKFVIRRSHVHPKRDEILHGRRGAGGLRQPGLNDKVKAALEAGHAVLLITVDETAAFTVRRLLDEESNSLWVAAIPPHPVKPAAAH